MEIKDKQLLQTVFSQALAVAACMQDEEKGIRQYVATEKAMDTIENNETIQFQNGILSFTSLRSGKKRNVTKYGCSNLCDCQNQPSYHQAMFNLLDEYTSILKKREAAKREQQTAPYFPAQLRPERKLEKIAGVRF